MFKVIYLTGAPASGKTTTANLLRQSAKSLEIWAYSERLQSHLAEQKEQASRDQLRRESSAIVTPEDIISVDGKLLDFVTTVRTKTNVIIDSHPVTREEYGFRVTAFSLEQLRSLAPDEIWVTFAGAAETVDRVAMDPQGRRVISEEAAAMHTSLQASVATTYGILCGKPVYFFDTGLAPEIRVKKMLSRLG